MRLFLVRHGQTAANTRLELDTADPGFPLTALGWEQAAALPAEFRGTELDLIVTSNLIRTKETAQPLAESRGMLPLVDEAAREIRAGELEMNSDEESIRIYHETVEAWSRGNLDPQIPGAENGHEVIERFTSVIERGRDAVGASGSLAIFAHGAIIRTWSRLRAENTDFERFHIVKNTGIIELDDSRGAWRIETWMGERA
ncbi:MAG: histidine phosphatase family protein [Ruaniaceae bacterium]|nr:histidine phosphatase family protein [Ruaniaceae bacterium]